jgi:Nuclear pore protein 84 / 107
MQYVRSMNWYSAWNSKLAVRPVRPLPIKASVSLTAQQQQSDRRRYEREIARYEEEESEWRRGWKEVSTATVDAILHCLQQDDCGWMQRAGVELEDWRRRVIPSLLFVLHRVCDVSEMGKECLQVADLVVDERYRLYDVMTVEERRAMMRKVKDSYIKYWITPEEDRRRQTVRPHRIDKQEEKKEQLQDEEELSAEQEEKYPEEEAVQQEAVRAEDQPRAREEPSPLRKEQPLMNRGTGPVAPMEQELRAEVQEEEEEEEEQQQPQVVAEQQGREEKADIVPVSVDAAHDVQMEEAGSHLVDQQQEATPAVLVFPAIILTEAPAATNPFQTQSVVLQPLHQAVEVNVAAEVEDKQEMARGSRSSSRQPSQSRRGASASRSVERDVPLQPSPLLASRGTGSEDEESSAAGRVSVPASPASVADSVASTVSSAVEQTGRRLTRSSARRVSRPIEPSSRVLRTRK